MNIKNIIEQYKLAEKAKGIMTLSTFDKVLIGKIFESLSRDLTTLWSDLRNHLSPESIIGRNERHLVKELDRIVKMTLCAGGESQKAFKEEVKGASGDQDEEEKDWGFEKIKEKGQQEGILLNRLIINPANILWSESKQKKSAEKFQEKFFKIFEGENYNK